MEGFTPWPPPLADRYRRKGYWAGICLGDLPRSWADRHGNREALVWGENRLDYSAMADVVDRLALGLLDIGVSPDDRVIVQLPNSGEFVLLCFALYRIGAMPVMALPAHRQHEIDHLIALSDATLYAVSAESSRFDYLGLALRMQSRHASLKTILTDREPPTESASIDRLMNRPPPTDEDRIRLDCLRPDPSTVALFLLSGGTTGLPKLIPRTHDDYVYNFRRSAELCGFNPGTRYVVVLPVAHNFPYGSPGLLGALNNGGTVVLAPSPNPATALPLIAREQVNVAAVVPAVAMRWMDDAPGVGADLDSLDLLQVGGARFAPEAASRVASELGCQLQQVFGMAEGLLNFTRLDEDASLAIETQGRPMCDDDELRIVDEAGQFVAEGEAGELLVRGPYTLRGYFRAPDHNKQAFTEDGFYRSGDIVRRHSSGNLTVEGRCKDLINRGGEKISAEEIENLMLAHPAIAGAAAVAMPDAVLGERVCAFVVPRAGQTLNLEILSAFMEERGIARFKLPERLEVIKALPLTPIGKIDKKALRASTSSQPN